MSAAVSGNERRDERMTQSLTLRVYSLLILPIMRSATTPKCYRMADELEQAGNGFADNGGPEMPHVHLLGDVGRREVDHHSLAPGSHGRTHALTKQYPEKFTKGSRFGYCCLLEG